MERERGDKTRPQGCKTARPARSARHWHSFSPSIGAEDVGVGNVHGCGCGDIVVHNRNVGIGKEGRPHILKIDERWSGSGEAMVKTVSESESRCEWWGSLGSEGMATSWVNICELLFPIILLLEFTLPIIKISYSMILPDIPFFPSFRGFQQGCPI